MYHISAVSEKSGFSEKACPDTSKYVLPRIYINDTNPTALSDVNRLFSVVVYLGKNK